MSDGRTIPESTYLTPFFKSCSAGLSSRVGFFGETRAVSGFVKGITDWSLIILVQLCNPSCWWYGGTFASVVDILWLSPFPTAVSVSAQDGIVALGKAHMRSAPSVSQQSPQGCPQNSADICLVEHRSFSTLWGGMPAASFLHSSFLQAIKAVMLWPVHVQKVPKPRGTKLQIRCDICCACQYICPFIPTDSGAHYSRSTEVFVGKDCAWLCVSQGCCQDPHCVGLKRASDRVSRVFLLLLVDWLLNAPATC